jgi:serine/threonine-protein kinase
LQSLAQAPERKTLDPLEPGQLIAEDRFEVIRRLGVGGQGTAYLCRDLSKKGTDTVVLKETIVPVFVESTVRRNALERFEQEAKMLKSLNSDSIVKLLDYFIEDHRAYLVLEHIDGCTLRELVFRDGPLAEDQVRDIAVQMCKILETLHAQSIVHRDFTPDNLILNAKGKLKLIDFNVAQQIQEGSTGTIVGKHAYLPPEQFRGKATAQSDLYAFGATLHFLLTGTDPEPISQSSPASISADVSSSMDQMVKHATALQLNRRFQTAAEIEKALLSEEADDKVLDHQDPVRDGSTISLKVTEMEEADVHG